MLAKLMLIFFTIMGLASDIDVELVKSQVAEALATEMGFEVVHFEVVEILEDGEQGYLIHAHLDYIFEEEGRKYRDKCRTRIGFSEADGVYRFRLQCPGIAVPVED